MGNVDFTAGITFRDDRMLTVDVTAIDADGIYYRSEDGDAAVAWSDVKAVMLATTDHMLESGGSLFAMAEVLAEAGDERSRDAGQMRRFGLELLAQAAPRLCRLGPACGLRPGSGPPAAGP
ncbi:MAG TPA: hypothetical protein VFJ85_11705 [Acidimicrobiales bacterium]|nr:hypothetical protein [Acidimicrobiales bacterium]